MVDAAKIGKVGKKKDRAEEMTDAYISS